MAWEVDSICIELKSGLWGCWPSSLPHLRSPGSRSTPHSRDSSSRRQWVTGKLNSGKCWCLWLNGSAVPTVVSIRCYTIFSTRNSGPDLNSCFARMALPAAKGAKRDVNKDTKITWMPQPLLPLNLLVHHSAPVFITCSPLRRRPLSSNSMEMSGCSYNTQFSIHMPNIFLWVKKKKRNRK